MPLSLYNSQPANEINRKGSKTRKIAGVVIKRTNSTKRRETWFDDECIVIAPPVTITDYSVFAERDVTNQKLAAIVRLPSPNNRKSSIVIKDDEEGNVYICNNDL